MRGNGGIERAEERQSGGAGVDILQPREKTPQRLFSAALIIGGVVPQRSLLSTDTLTLGMA